jgi:chromate transporter
MSDERQGASVQPAFREALRYWLRLGFINFGGPAGQIAIMHRELVDQRRWISEGAFLRALNFCTILPGPEAQQLATFVGWRLHGMVGGLAAGTLFILPGFAVLLALSWLAASHGDVTAVAGMLYGVQPVVIAIVAEAVLRIGRRALRPRGLVAFAIAAFVAIYFLRVPFPAVVAGAAALGLILHRFRPDLVQRPGRQSGTGDGGDVVRTPVSMRRNALIAFAFVCLWAVPVGLIWLMLGPGSVLFKEALFFTWAAFVTFGGAYAVLSLVADQAVNVHGWLTATQMVQGLGLAESTPGPLIMVTQYVGFFGGYNSPGAFSPVVHGVLGASVTTYVTFLPSFLFIFLGAPYVERMAGNRRIAAAMTGVTAAVVGVIANLGVFFASRVLVPEGGGFDLYAAVAAAGSFVVMWRWHVAIHWLVAAGAVLGIMKVLVERAL